MINPKEIEKIRHQLEEERMRLLGEPEEQDSAEEDVSYNLGRGELATDARRQYRQEAIGAMEEQKLAQIDAALNAIKAGTYGQCSNCGEPINVERLNALPFATFCIDCQAKASSASN